MSNHSIPIEITQEIASRLSPLNVIRLQTVNVFWNEMIHSPNFVNSNFDHMMNQNRSLLILDEVLLSSHVAYEVTGPSSYSRTLLEDDEETEVVAHSRGLVCSADRLDNFFIFNPITFERRDVPSILIEWVEKAELADACFGMGYVSSSNSYVLLRLVTFQTPCSNTQIDVYSTNKNEWKRLNPFPFGVPAGKFGVWVRGRIHFHVYMCGSLSTEIRTYNPEDESWGLLKLPPSVETSSRSWEISELDDNTLVVFQVHHSRRISCKFKIWVFQGYGLNERWSRLNITFNVIDVLPHPFILQPLLLIKPANKKILFRKDPIGTYGTYDIDLNTWEDIDAQPGSIINGNCRFYNVRASLVVP